MSAAGDRLHELMVREDMSPAERLLAAKDDLIKDQEAEIDGLREYVAGRGRKETRLAMALFSVGLALTVATVKAPLIFVLAVLFFGAGATVLAGKK